MGTGLSLSGGDHCRVMEEPVFFRTTTSMGGSGGCFLAARDERVECERIVHIKIHSVCVLSLTSDGKPRRRLAVSSHEGHLSGVVGLAVLDGEGVLSETAADGHSGVLLQTLAVARPVGVGAGMLQLHTEDDCVADRNHRSPGKFLGDVA